MLSLSITRKDHFQLFGCEPAALRAVLSLSTAFIIARILYCLFFHPLRSVPGPFVAKFTELWRTNRYRKGNWHKDILDLHYRYGSVVRISPNEVSIVDKIGLTSIYGHVNGTRKTKWYDVWKIPGTNDSFFNATNPAQHSFLRKRVAYPYSMSTLVSSEADIQEVADALWHRFDQFAQEGTVIDMHDWTSYFAYDVVGKMCLGKPIGFIEECRDIQDIIRSIHVGFYYMSNLGYIPGQQLWIHNIITQLVSKIFGRGKLNVISKFGQWALEQVLDRIQNPGSPTRKKDMLDHFITMKEPNGEPANLPSILVEVGNIIGAGADTTSIGIRTVLAQLLLHKEDYLQARYEVDKAYASYRASGGTGSLPHTTIDKLPFLNACIKESLRLHPSILWQLPREAPSNGVEIAGYYIPSSATISMSPIAQNRDKTVFGPDAHQYKPSRWIAGKINDDAKIKEMDKFLVTFGYGARTCIGRNLALLEINKFISEFIRRYDADFVNRERPYVIFSQWFSYQADMFVRIALRNH